MIVDSHCHLDFPDFAEDIDGVLQRCRDIDMTALVTICTTVARFPAIYELTARDPMIWCSVGTHPNYVPEEPDAKLEDILTHARLPKVVAIGEAGLDFHYMKSSPQEQEKVFRTHIEAARQTGLPLVIHSRDAEDETIRILRDEYSAGPFKAVLHCFSSKAHLAQAGLEMGMYVSFSGIVTFKAAEELRAVARNCPRDRILIETDAPFLAPVPKRGKRNQPSYVAHTCAHLADTLGMTADELATLTTDNFFALFTKATPTLIRPSARPVLDQA